MNPLLLKLTTFLLAAVLVVPLTKRYKLGSVLGYLLAGIIIGPYVLGYLSGNDQNILMRISEFGVVMMMFLIGIEIKPSLLFRLRVAIFGMGGMQMLLCLLATGIVAKLFGQTWQSALAIGMILSLSSTALVMQILSEQKQLTTRVGRSIFAVLLFQDIAVIPIFAVLPILASQTSVNINLGHTETTAVGVWLAQQEDYIRVLITLSVITLIIAIGRYSSSRIFRLIAATRLRDIFTATALLIVTGVALLMELVGLSAAFGTFLAGVMLAESEYRHEIELSIEPFKSLLLGLFFISVGASIDFQLLAEMFGLVVTLVVLYVITKLGVLFVLAKKFQFTHRQALLFAVALAQGGEFAFVLFAFAEQNNVLSNKITAILTLVVILSMLITPLLMTQVEKYLCQRSSKGTIKEESAEISEVNPVIIAGYGRFNQIVGRMLQANGIACTVLDNNPDLIDTLGHWGQKVYYGDASRLDLLRAAGAEQAQLLIIGIRDCEQVVDITKMAREHFPHLKILARASDRINAYHLLDVQADRYVRDLFHSALMMGEMALVEMGYHPHAAHRKARIFRQHDEDMVHSMYEIWKKDPHQYGSNPGKQYISRTRELVEEFLAVLRRDKELKQKRLHDDHAWESAPTETEIMEQALREEMRQAREKINVEELVAAAQAEQLSEQVIRATQAVTFKTDGKDSSEINTTV